MVEVNSGYLGRTPKFDASATGEVVSEATPLPNQLVSSKITPRSYTPENLLRLQRTIGNRAVMRLLANRKPKAEPTPVQRLVKISGQNIDNLEEIFADIVKDAKEIDDNPAKFKMLLDYGIISDLPDKTEALSYWRKAGLEDAALKEIIKPFAHNPTKTWLAGDVSKAIANEVHYQLEPDAFLTLSLTLADKPVKIILKQTKQEVLEGLDKPEPKLQGANNYDYTVDTNGIHLEFEAVLKGDQSIIENCDIGFVQTVVSVERILTTNAKEFPYKLEKPAKDGPTNYPDIWYDPASKNEGKFENQYELKPIKLYDKPGFNWSMSGKFDYQTKGSDSYKTWLVLRYNGVVHYLKMWKWDVDWKAGGIQNFNEASVETDAVLTGPNAKEILNK